MTLPRVITEDVGGSPLARAAQRDELPQWYTRRPRGADEWGAYLAEIASTYRSKGWLERLAPALGEGINVNARLRRVVESGGVVVSTGQQAALFGGPLYTLVKAIGALGLADALEQATGIPAAPVFWAATDDADYDEASWASVAVVGGVRTIRLPPPERPGIPMSNMPMPGVSRLVDDLAQACGSAADAEALESVRRSYTPATTLGDAYVRQLRELLEPIGIAVLDASHPAVRRAAEPVLARALTEAVAVEGALRARYDAIHTAGFLPQVEDVPALSLVFTTVQGAEKQRVPIREAAGALRRYPIEALSPNVLLRPVVERFIMPSAAYLAGPGELSYFAQVSAVAESLELARPLAVTRWSATLLEPRVERLLARLGVSREELRDRRAVETRLARDTIPVEVAESLRTLRRDVEADIAAVNVADRDNLVPPASLEGLRRSLLHRLERAERRYVAAVKRRETELMRDVSTAAAALYPDGIRQERVLNFVPFLARYGRSLLNLMRGEALRHASSIVGVSGAPASAPMVERV